MAIAELIPMLKDEARKRQATSGPGLYGAKPLPPKTAEAVEQDDDQEDHSQPSALCGDTRDIAARALGVSHTMVQLAANIKEADPEAFERIKRGEAKVGLRRGDPRQRR